MDNNYEQIVIGTILSRPAEMEAAVDLQSQDFTSAHAAIWRMMQSLYRQSGLSTRHLIEEMRISGDLDTVGTVDSELHGENYIFSLLSMATDNIEFAVRKVEEQSLRKQITSISAIIRAEANNQNISIDEALDNAERRLMSLRRSTTQQGVQIGTLGDMLSGRIEQMRSGTFRPAYVPKIEEIATMVGYAEADDYIIIAARPGEGKSSIIRYDLVSYAVEDHYPVAIINMENSPIEYARYAVSMLTGINSDKIKEPRYLTEIELGRISSAVQRLKAAPLHIISMGSPSAVELERTLRSIISANDIRIVGVDYVQLMHNPSANSKIEDVTESSRALRAMSLRYRVPMLVASQMSRAIAQRGDDAEPELSDLRESGGLEQDATCVMFPRQVWKNPTPDQLRRYPENRTSNDEVVSRAVPIRVYIKKNRNGPIGTTDPFLWVKSKNLFRKA